METILMRFQAVFVSKLFVTVMTFEIFTASPFLDDFSDESLADVESDVDSFSLDASDSSSDWWLSKSFTFPLLEGDVILSPFVSR
jgi:hypothetical protein